MRTSFLILLAGLTAVAAPAAAADDVSVAVKTADLNLAEKADQVRLSNRMARAATSACFDPGRDGTEAHGAFMKCKTAALQKARAKVEVLVAAATRQSRSNLELAGR